MKCVVERSLLLGWDATAAAGPAPEEEAAAPAAGAGLAPDLKHLDRIGNLLFMGLLREAGSVRGLALRLKCTPQAIYSRMHRMGIGPRDIAGDLGIERQLASLREEVRELLPWVQSILRG